MRMRQKTLADCLPWWEAVRCRLLRCDGCGKILDQGYFWDGERRLCLGCSLRRRLKIKASG